MRMSGSLIEMITAVKPGCPVKHPEFQLVVTQGYDGVYSLVNLRFLVFYPAATAIELLQLVGTSYSADFGWRLQCWEVSR